MPDDPAEGRRLADRAAGIGPDRARREAPGDGRGAAAGGAARHASGVPRVEDRAVAGVLVRRAHRELVHVRLAEHPRAGLAKLADGRRRVRRPVALEDPRARRGRDALGAEDVLDRDGIPSSGSSPSRRPAPPGPSGLPRRSTGRRSASRPPPPRGRRRSTRPRESSPERIRSAASATVRSISSPPSTPAARGRGRRRRPGQARARAPRRDPSSAEARRAGRRSRARSRARSARPRRGRARRSCSTCSRIPESSLRHPLDLLVAQLEPRKPGDVLYLFPLDHAPDHR